MTAPLISCSYILKMELFEVFNFNLSSLSLITEVISLFKNSSIIKRNYNLSEDYNVEKEKWID